MKVDTQGHTLRISQVGELGTAGANSFRDRVTSVLTEGQRDIDIDLAGTPFLDSCGLGALISLHKMARARNGAVRLLNPQPPVLQILELTQMGRIFEIVKD